MIDRDATEYLEEPLQVPQFVDGVDHHKAHRPRAGDLHYRPIDPAYMVAEQQYAAFSRDMAHALHLDAVMRADDAAQDEAGKTLR